jgi:hypothetical protein
MRLLHLTESGLQAISPKPSPNDTRAHYPRRVVGSFVFALELKVDFGHVIAARASYLLPCLTALHVRFCSLCLNI